MLSLSKDTRVSPKDADAFYSLLKQEVGINAV